VVDHRLDLVLVEHPVHPPLRQVHHGHGGGDLVAQNPIQGEHPGIRKGLIHHMGFKDFLSNSLSHIIHYRAQKKKVKAAINKIGEYIAYFGMPQSPGALLRK
jgi:hypothetical protein